MEKNYSEPVGRRSGQAAADDAERAGGRKVSFDLVFACLTVAAVAAYYNSFGNSFQLDDFHIAVENPWV